MDLKIHQSKFHLGFKEFLFNNYNLRRMGDKKRKQTNAV